MGAKELMIGDLVYYLTANGLHIKAIVEDADSLGLIEKGTVTVEPIPLTKEIVEANFQTECEGSGVFGIGYVVGDLSDDSVGSILLEDRTDDFGYYSLLRKYGKNSTHWLINVKYVHELQHALKAYGIEKQITIES